jgi:predicted nucleotidyltransferase
MGMTGTTTTKTAIQDMGLARLIERIVESMAPEAIYLFGSRARGTECPDSDYDILVIVPDTAPDATMAPDATYDLARSARVAADVVTCRRAGFDRWRDEVGTLSYEATHFGRLVYGR